MPQFVIEREMPGAGKLSKDDLKGASQGSCNVLRELGPEILTGKPEAAASPPPSDARGSCWAIDSRLVW